MKITKSRLKKAIREVLEEIEEEMIKDTPRSQIRKDPEPEEKPVLSEEFELEEEKMPEDVLAIKKAINKKRLKKDAEDAKKAKKES